MATKPPVDQERASRLAALVETDMRAAYTLSIERGGYIETAAAYESFLAARLYQLHAKIYDLEFSWKPK
jgi:hypothetical protein